jgi:hypothetical protein
MTSFTVYLPGKESEELKRSASKKGISPGRLLRMRLKAVVRTEQHMRLETRLEAILRLLELILPEIGYTSGANRAASASISSAVQRGQEIENFLKKTASEVRTQLEKKAGEVRL